MCLSRPRARPPRASDIDSIGAWIETAASIAGLEAQPSETTYAEFDRALHRLGPALLHVPTENGPAFLAILRDGRVLTPALEKIRVDPALVRSALCADAEAPVLAEIEEMLGRAGIPEARESRARDAILRERLSAKRIRGIWMLRLPPGASFWAQLRHARISRDASPRSRALTPFNISFGFSPGSWLAHTFCAARPIAPG